MNLAKQLDTPGLEGLRIRNGYRLRGLQVDTAGSGLYLMADFITTLIELSPLSFNFRVVLPEP